MAVSNAQKIATKKYREKTYDTIGFDVKKGKRDEYKQFATQKGLSLAGMLTNAAEEYIRNHAGENVLDKQQDKKSLSPADEKLLAEFSKLPVDAQKSLMQFLRTLNQKGGVQND